MSTPAEEVKLRLDIVELIGEYVQLKQVGTNWKARCPFHNERTPSFMVSRERGSWHCFGCARGGDIFSFIQEMEGMDFPEALRFLAKRAGVEVRQVDPKLATQRTKLLDVMRWAMRYYHEVLLKAKEAHIARDYLVKRQVTAETIDEWQLGYAPTGGDTAYRAMRAKGFSDDDIFQAGLTIKKDRGAGYFDRFRGRVMFPIADLHGTVVGCSGRILDALVDPTKPTPAKYINSPQTLIYNKSAILFGLDKAKQPIKKAERAVLVEGYMDCIASHQAGRQNVVASSGTALTRDQVKLLKRYTNMIVLAFDADAAGAQAALRGVDQALQEEVNVLMLRLPYGKDPDELISKDPAAWDTAVAKAQPIMEYYFEEATANRDVTQVKEKKAIAKFLLPILAKVGDAIEQTHYLQKLADLLRVDEQTLRRSMPKPLPAAVAQPKTALSSAPTTIAPTAPPSRLRAVSERLIAALIHTPTTLERWSQDLDPNQLIGDDLRDLYKTLVIWYTQGHLKNRTDLDRLIGGLDPEQRDVLNLLLLLSDKEFSEETPAAVSQDVAQMVTTLTRHALAQQLHELEQDIRRLERQSDAASRHELSVRLEHFQSVTDQLRRLA